MIHVLDIKNKYFQDIKSGLKTFEIRRKNKNYQINDKLKFINLETKETIEKEIIYISEGAVYNLKNIIVLGIK